MANSITTTKIEEFVNNYLKEDLKELEKHLNMRNVAINEYNQLKTTINTLAEQFAGKITTQVDIGGNYFIQAKIPKTDRVIVNIGKNIYMDFTLDEALIFVDFQLRVLNKEADVIREESIKKRAEIKFALLCIGTKGNMYSSDS